MKIQNVGVRGILFTFYDIDGFLTNVYVIIGNKFNFIIDTYLGPEPMDKIAEYINAKYEKKPFIVFNSHFHWDHIWGNCRFESSLIISQEICRDMMGKYGEKQLQENAKYKRGNVRITYPNIVFKEKMVFCDEGIEIFHSPGHTEDSASLFDTKDSVLFAGDNIEEPIPYLEWDDLKSYRATLEKYLELGPNFIICGHCDVVDKTLVDNNLYYIKKYMEGDTTEFEQYPYFNTHMVNIRNVKK